ncbi:MAG: hypothetical protein GY794_12295 [bacterium]|nr:hypothetical protein [bacterium]
MGSRTYPRFTLVRSIAVVLVLLGMFSCALGGPTVTLIMKCAKPGHIQHGLESIVVGPNTPAILTRLTPAQRVRIIYRPQNGAAETILLNLTKHADRMLICSYTPSGSASRQGKVTLTGAATKTSLAQLRTFIKHPWIAKADQMMIDVFQGIVKIEKSDPNAQKTLSRTYKPHLKTITDEFIPKTKRAVAFISQMRAPTGELAEVKRLYLNSAENLQAAIADVAEAVRSNNTQLFARGKASFVAAVDSQKTGRNLTTVLAEQVVRRHEQEATGKPQPKDPDKPQPKDPDKPQPKDPPEPIDQAPSKITLAITGKAFETEAAIDTRFTATPAPRCLWLVVCEKGSDVSDGAWGGFYIRKRSSGTVRLNAPAVPGEYEVRAYDQFPAKGPANATTSSFVVSFPAGESKPSSGLPMEPVGRPLMFRRPLEKVKEPPLTVVAIAAGTRKSLAKAIAGFHKKWMTATPPEPRRSLQINVKQPAFSVSLALGHTGDDRKSSLSAEVQLQLDRKGVAKILSGSPVILAASSDSGKGMFLYRLTYAPGAADRASVTLGELLAESEKMGHPATRRARKKATTKPKDDKPVVEGPPLWETDQWNQEWPLPVKRDKVPDGVRQYHGRLEAFPLDGAKGPFKWPNYVDIRFDWSKDGGVDVNWASAWRTWEILSTRLPVRHDPTTYEAYGKEDPRERDSLPTLNGQPQTAQARPKEDSPTSTTGGDLRTSGLYSLANVDHHIKIDKASSASNTIQIGYTFYSKGAVYKEMTLDKKKADKWKRIKNSKRVLEDRWKINAIFDPKTSTFYGTFSATVYRNWPDGKGGEAWGPRTKTTRFRSRMWEYGTEEVESSSPLKIDSAEGPEGLVRAGKEFPLKVKIVSTEDAEDEDAKTHPYTLVLFDVVTDKPIVPAVKGILKPGAETTEVFDITPPAMNGEWKIRAFLKTTNKAEDDEEVSLLVGTFPVQATKAEVLNRRVNSDSAFNVDIELKNLRSAKLVNDRKARGAGSCMLYDHHTKKYRNLKDFDLAAGEKLTFDAPSLRTPKVTKTLYAWKLSVVILDENGETVSYRMLPHIRVDAPPPPPPVVEIPKTPKVASISPEQKAEIDRINNCNVNLQNTQRSVMRLAKKISHAERVIALGKTAKKNVGAKTEKKMLEQSKIMAKSRKAQKREFSDLKKSMEKEVDHYKEMVKKNKGKPSEKYYRDRLDTVTSVFSKVKINALGANSLSELYELAHKTGKDDKFMAAEAYKQLAVRYIRAGKLSSAHLALIKSREIKPKDRLGDNLQRCLESRTIASISNKLEGEIGELQAGMNRELGLNGTDGFWGTTYDLMATGPKTALTNFSFSHDGQINQLEEIVSSAENDGRAQQVGLMFMKKLVKAGMTIKQTSKLDITYLFAAQELCANKWPSINTGLFEISHELRKPNLSKARRTELERAQRCLKRVGTSLDFKECFPGLQQMMNGSKRLSNRSVLSAYVSMRAAMKNPDIQKVMKYSLGTLTGPDGKTTKWREGLASEHSDYSGMKSFLGVEVTEKGTGQMIAGAVLDMPTVMMAITMSPSAQLAGGGTVAQFLANGVGKLSPSALKVVQSLAEIRRDTGFISNLTFDVGVSIAVDVGVTHVTGDKRKAFLAAGFLDGLTNGLDAEGICRKLTTKKVSAGMVSEMARKLRSSLDGFIAPVFQMGLMLTKVEKQMVLGFVDKVADTLRSKAKAIKEAITDAMPGSMRSVRNKQASLMDQAVAEMMDGKFFKARKTLQKARAIGNSCDAAADQIHEGIYRLDRVVRRMRAQSDDLARKTDLEASIRSTLGPKNPFDKGKPFTSVQLDALMKDPKQLHRYINASVLSKDQQTQVASLARDRFLAARKATMEEVGAYKDGLYAQLFDYFEDVGSWHNGKLLRDIDFSAKLKDNPPIDVLRKLYATVDGVGKMSDVQLTKLWRKDAGMHRDVLVLFENRLGENLAKQYGRSGGNPKSILKEFEVVMNEIPGEIGVSGKRKLSLEEYRTWIYQVLGDTEAEKNITKISFKGKSLKLQKQLTAADVGKASSMELKPWHAQAKVYDQWIMFRSHWDKAAHPMDNLANTMKYAERVRKDMIRLISKASDKHLGSSALKIRSAMAAANTRHLALLRKAASLKKRATKAGGYAQALDEIFAKEIKLMKQKYPSQGMHRIRAAVAAQHYKQMEAYMREMVEITGQIKGAKAIMSKPSKVGGGIRQFLDENKKITANIPPPQ